jgi:hypothetical protein
MRTVTFKSVVDGVFALAGVTRSTAADPTALLGQVIEAVNLRVREGYEHEFWPELCRVEQRAYRAAYASGTSYTAGAEIWFPNADEDLQGYYSANSSPNTPSAGQSPETHPAKWTALDSFDRYIALDQAGLTAIGEVMALYTTDPGLRPGSAGRVAFALSPDGIVPASGAPDRVWVWFRQRPPAYTAANYAGTEGDFLLPYVLDSFIRRAAYADFLRMDGKFDEAGRADARAYQDLTNASDASGASQGQFTTAGVRTY